MTTELTNIIQLIKAKEFELAYQLMIGNPWIYMDCSDEEFRDLYHAYYTWVERTSWHFRDRARYIDLWNTNNRYK